MFEGYLELGGGEVLNNARAKGYTDTSRCGAAWLVCQPCDGIRDVLNDDPYYYETIHEAPWYDAEDEPTHRFLGAYGLKIEGLPDSTREADVAEGIMDGGVVGRVRRGTRRMRVEAMLTAIGEDALEAGFSWLDSALSPGKCGTHGDACGAADARVFAACPPERADVTSSDVLWNDPVTNLATNPSFETAGSSSSVIVATNLATNPSMETTGVDTEMRRNLVTDHPSGLNSVGAWSSRSSAVLTAGATGVVVDIPAGETADRDLVRNESPQTSVPWENWSTSVDVEVPAGYPEVTVKMGVEYEAAFAFFGPSVTVYPGQKVRISHSISSDIAANTRPVIRSGAQAIPVGTRFIVSRVIFEKTLAGGPFFDGSTLPSGDWTYLWLGTPEASVSVQNGKAVTGYSSGQGAEWVASSQVWKNSGSRSLRVISNGRSDNSFSRVPPLTLTPGKTYTAQVTMHQAAVHIGTNTGFARQLFVEWFNTATGGYEQARTTTPPNTPGTYPLSLTFTIPASVDPSQTSVRLYVGSSVAGDEVWFDDFMVVEGAYTGPYFDGATPAGGDFTYAWTGTAHASTSTASRVTESVAGVTTPNPTQVTVALTSDTPARGAKAMRFTLASTTAVHLPVTDVAVTAPTLYTLVGKVRPRTRDQSLAPEIGGVAGPAIVAPKDVWTSFRIAVATGAGGSAQTGLILTGGSGHQVGDIIDVDEVMLIEGNYSGPYFDGDTPDSPPSNVAGTNLGEYAWTGTPHASTSTGRAGKVTNLPDPIAYDAKISRMVRNLHTVTCVSGPTIVRKMHRGNTWGYLVEFVLVAAVPWMFGDTKPVSLSPSSPIVIQDVPFNLVPYPSAELAAGTVIASTNFVTNPSIETAITGWSVVKSVVIGESIARSTELASAGSASAKAILNATNAGVNGYLGAQQEVLLPGITATTRYSVNIWASASSQSGTAVLGALEYRIRWQDAASTVLRDDLLASGVAAGGPVSVKSILPPAGTTKASVRVLIRLTSWSVSDIVRLYADAVAVTVP